MGEEEGGSRLGRIPTGSFKSRPEVPNSYWGGFQSNTGDVSRDIDKLGPARDSPRVYLGLYVRQPMICVTASRKLGLLQPSLSTICNYVVVHVLIHELINVKV